MGTNPYTADDGEQIVINEELAETLLEATGTLRDDIASGREWGGPEDIEELCAAHEQLRERLEAADGGR